jgi:osmotically-inducible protein OsmY
MSCSAQIVRYMIMVAVASVSLQTGAQVPAEPSLHDAWLKGRLDTLLLLDPNLRAYALSTEVRGGEVVLAGEVATKFEKEFAADIAMTIAGIDQIDNEISVSSAVDAPIPQASLDAQDRAISAAIRTKFLLNPKIDSSAIEIDTKENYVQLKGTVTSAAERELANTIARTTYGVETLQNFLQVIAY